MSLYTVAERTKKAVNISIGLLIFLVIAKLSWNFGVFIYRQLNPPEIPPPQVAYGKVPELNISSLPLKEGSNPTYNLETVTGNLPIMPGRTPVYKLTDRPRSISFEKRAIDFAASLGFTGERIEESSIDWVWRDRATGRTLRMNIFTKDFEIETDLGRVAPTVPKGSSPSLREAESRSVSFLKSANLYDQIIEDGEITSRYLQISNDKPEVVDTREEAQMVEVNFFISLNTFPRDFPGFRTNLLPANFPILTNNPKEGVIRMLVADSSNEKYDIPQIKFNSQRIDEKERSTYPLKNVNAAWNQLKNGEGKITYLRIEGDNPYSNYIPLELTEVEIRKVQLAYFDSGLPYKSFLEPIFVFEGEAFTQSQLRAEFVAYVQALDPICQGDAKELGKPCSNQSSQR